MNYGYSVPPIATETKQIRVLIADDHMIVREGLSAIIGRRSDMQVVAQAANGRQAVDLWQEHRPDVSLLDLRMPTLDGVGVIEEVRRRDPSARLVVLTTYDSDLDISNAIKAGAKGYLLKDAPTEDLLHCIREVHAGGTSINASLVAKLATSISADPLTRREIEVLNLLAKGKSNREMALALYISEATVKTHLRNIFTKLNVICRTEAITTASKRGIIQI